MVYAPSSSATVTTWAELQSAVAAGGTVTLGTDLVPPNVPANDRLDLVSATTTIDLNGHQLLIPSPPANEAAVHVPPGAALTVEDTIGTGLLTVTGGPGGNAAIGGDYIGSVSESNGGITFASGSHTVINAGSGGFAIGPSGLDANSQWTNAGTLTLNGLTPMDGQSGDGLINTGTIHLNGNMFGTGTLTNNGIIIVGPAPDAISTSYTWIGNHYAIAYDVNYSGGTNPSGQTVLGPTLASTSQSLPSLPTRVGYTSVGWFPTVSGGSKITNASALASLYSPLQNSPTFHAHWALIVETVSFNSRGGSQIGSEHVNFGSPAIPPAKPKRSGYTFLGWSSSATGKPLWSFNTPIKAPATLYAAWNLVPIVAPTSQAAAPPPAVLPSTTPPLAQPSSQTRTPTPTSAASSSSTSAPAPSPTPTPSPFGDEFG